jgi:hypothetical protein
LGLPKNSAGSSKINFIGDKIFFPVHTSNHISPIFKQSEKFQAVLNWVYKPQFSTLVSPFDTTSFAKYLLEISDGIFRDMGDT